MDFKIDPKIFEKYPEVTLGVIVACNIDNSGTNPEIINLLRSVEDSVREKFAGVEVIEHPNIAVWRETYRTFGAKPKDYPSSIENLVRSVLKGHEIRHINKLVDIYNYISLKYLLPAGGEDLDKIVGDVFLTFASENEKPIVLLGEQEGRPPHAGEVIYKDDNGAICRRWNWKEADRTKFSETTKNCVLVLESLPPITKDSIETSLTELKELVIKFCGGEVLNYVLDSQNSQVKLM